MAKNKNIYEAPRPQTFHVKLFPGRGPGVKALDAVFQGKAILNREVILHLLLDFLKNLYGETKLARKIASIPIGPVIP